MSKRKDELKAKLLSEAEASLERMLLDERMSEQMTMTAIEDVIGEMEIDFRQRVLREVLGEQEEPALRFPDCGGQIAKQRQA